jgi:hypothetical protein
MATQGIKVTDLPEITEIPSDGYMFLTTSNSTNKIKTSSFFRTFSAVKGGINLGSGLSLYNNYQNQNLYFNTLTAVDGLSATNTNNTITLRLQDNSISTNKYQNSSITGPKIKDNTITGYKLNDFGKDFSSSATKTDIQVIPKNIFNFVTNLSATILCPTSSAKVMINGFLSINSQDAAINIYRKTTNQSNFSVISPLSSIPSGYASCMFDGGSTDLNNPKIVPLSFLDTPNYSGIITYVVGVSSMNAGESYINRSFNALAQNKTVSVSHINALVLP